jgi:hypothetical protein
MTAEHHRLADANARRAPLGGMWGPYLSERQWGTVREDYSPNGSAWTSCTTTWPAPTPIAGVRMA